MKKLILPAIVLILSIFFTPFFPGNVHAQEKDPLDCAELRQILGSKECPGWVMNDYSVWCAQTEEELLRYYTDEYGNPGMEHLYKNRVPDYLVDRSITVEELNACGADTAAGQGVNAKENSQNPEQTGQQTISPVEKLTNWINDTFGKYQPKDLPDQALVENTPSNDDLKPVAIPVKSPPPPLTGIITELDGNADMQLSDGTWVELKKGDFVPPNAKVFTGYDVRMQIQLSDSIPIILDSLEEFNLELFQTNPEIYRKELKLKDYGALRFKVKTGTLHSDFGRDVLKVSTPNTTASIYGTDFGIAYNKDTGTSIWEIYDGEIEVQNNSTGEKKTISTSYGSPIKRLEIKKDSSMVEKTVTPKGKSSKIPVWSYVLGAVVLVAGTLFFLKKRAQLPKRGKRSR